MNPGRDPALLIEIGDAATLALMTHDDLRDLARRAYQTPIDLIALASLGHWIRGL